MYTLDEIHTAILNHTALKLAALTGDERAQVLRQRIHQLIGMLELARRLDDLSLVHFLEAHRDALMRMLAAT